MPTDRITRTLPPLALAALVLAGCSPTPDETTEPPSAPAATIEFTTELDHLHGLHVDAAGTVLAGTHTGLIAVDASGTTARVGESDDDLMGLTGAPRSDTLFASGHPGRSSSAADPLGLRSSADGGRTWTDRSLAGDVDFHVLATNGTILVGFDGTTGLRVSVDGGTTWTPGAAEAVASLAVTDGGVWAITAGGLRRSTDTARSFSTVPDAPPLIMLAGAGEALWGIDQDGYAWRSREGQAWQKSAYVGAVDALTAVGYDRAYTATSTALYMLD